MVGIGTVPGRARDSPRAVPTGGLPPMIRTAIVDDDPEVVAQLEAAIARSDDVVVAWVARNARSSLALIEAGEFDVLLCDLGLPDGNGITLIRRTASLHPDVDIIVVTMFADQRKVLDSIRAGARGYLLKDHRLLDCVTSIHEIRAGGSPISPIIARQLLKRLQPATPTVADPSVERLSERETHVLELLARGFSYAECAGLLSVSPHTIGTFVKRIYRKLQVSSRAEAVFEASSRGILDAH
jgi:DNA-binding NarL/FixJ family response regulator